MKRQKIILDGYFDSNFGDDYMMMLVVRSLPEYDFVITCNNGFEGFLLSEPNVEYSENPDKSLPVLIVTGSGFMINSWSSLKCELKWFLKGHKVGNWCIGCNIEPFKSRLSEFLVKHKLQKLSMIICRDKKSFAWLEKNCRGVRCHYLPDIVFSLPDELIPHKTDENLGISVLHRSGDGEDCDYYKKMAYAADYFIELTGKKVLLMAFDTGTEDDGFACRCVKKLMKHPEHTELVFHGLGGEILNAYSRCSKVIGARFHSAVLAMRTGTAFFPVIYREKMRNLLYDTGYPVMGSDIDAVNPADIENFINNNIKSILCKEMVRGALMYPEYFRTECNRESELV